MREDDELAARLAGLKVLVVEDHDAARKALCALLRSFGPAVVGAADGRQGLEAVARERPDLVFCDLRMPGMGGFDFLKGLRAGEGRGRIKVVAMSGLGSDADLAEIAGAGFDGHLVKPVDTAALQRELGRLFPPVPPD